MSMQSNRQSRVRFDFVGVHRGREASDWARELRQFLLQLSNRYGEFLTRWMAVQNSEVIFPGLPPDMDNVWSQIVGEVTNFANNNGFTHRVWDGSILIIRP